jgi:hypothetical protein
MSGIEYLKGIRAQIPLNSLRSVPPRVLFCPLNGSNQLKQREPSFRVRMYSNMIYAAKSQNAVDFGENLLRIKGVIQGVINYHQIKHIVFVWQLLSHTTDEGHGRVYYLAKIRS